MGRHHRRHYRHTGFSLNIKKLRAAHATCIGNFRNDREEVVMYDLPLMFAEDNPSIIRVEHGDISAAAASAIAILADERKWNYL